METNRPLDCDTIQSVQDHGKLLIHVSRIQMLRRLRQDVANIKQGKQAMKRDDPVYQIDTDSTRQTGNGAAWVLIMPLGTFLACVVVVALIGILSR